MRRLVAVVLLVGACAGSPPHPATALVSPAPPATRPATTPATRPAPRLGAITGAVRTAWGVPIDGAVVAAVPYAPASTDATAPAALVRSGRDGQFRLEGLAPGEYGVTATAPGVVASSLGHVIVTPGEAASGDLALGGTGPTLSGQVRDERGAPIARAEVRAERYGNASGDVFYARTDGRGGFTMMLPSASYAVTAHSPGRASDELGAVVRSDRTVELVAYRLAPPGPAPREVVDWIRTRALPLATAEPGHGSADLVPLRHVVGDARIVALGEATHGTREFFQLKHRILEYLVTQLGFTVFAIEASWPESLDIDEYVRTGKGDPQRALAVPWNTAEVLDLIRWMRSYNEDPAHRRKLRFYGFDASPTMAAQRVVAYVTRVEPTLAPRAALALAPWASAPFDREQYSHKSVDEHRANTAGLDELARRFDQAKARWTAKRGRTAWEIARQHLRIVQQSDALTAPDTVIDAAALATRERFMAENVRWVLEHEPPGTRMVLWAHNAHVARGGTGMARASMGAHLARSFGPAMVVVGFAFDQGSFQAMGMRGGTPSGSAPRAFTVPPAPPGSLDATLAASGLPLLALDVRAAPGAGPVGEWLRTRHLSWSIGSVFDDTAPLSFFAPTDVSRAFDVVVFVARTTRARPIRSTSAAEAPLLAAPANLDFEAGARPGEVPPHWYVSAATREAGFRVSVSDRQAYAGKRCVVIEGKPKWTGAFGVLVQRVDATPYRGKRVRLRAAVRSDGTAPAMLWLRVDRKNGEMGFFDNMFRRSITAREWRPYEIVGDVDADAERLNFGLWLRSKGRAWVDSVTLEVVPPSYPQPVPVSP